MQSYHWKAHNTFTNFYLKDITWSDNDNNMYLGPVVAAQHHPLRLVILGKKGKGGGAEVCPFLKEIKSRGTSTAAKSSDV